MTTAHSTPGLKRSDKTSTVSVSKEDIYATVGRKKGITRPSVEELDYDPYESVNIQSEIQREEHSDREIKPAVTSQSSNYNCNDSSSKTTSQQDLNGSSLKVEPIENDLYSKVKKISSVSDGINLNSDFVSIYDLTKVDSNIRTAPDNDQIQRTNHKVEQNSQSVNDYKNNIIESSSDPKLGNLDLDFSTERESYPIEEVQTDSEDEKEVKEETDNELKVSSQNDWINQTSVESDPIPKMNINMFIQKNAKQTVRSWPKVETHTGARKPEDISPTKQLIGKFNQGLNQPAEPRAPPNTLKSPTKLLINKFNNPSEKNKIPAPGGFHGINPMPSTTKTASKFQPNYFLSTSTSSNRYQAQSKSPVPLPRFQNTAKNSQVAKLVNTLNASTVPKDEDDEANRVSILKRNCGLHGWQAADI